MKLVCAPVKTWPESLPVDLYEFTEGDAKFLYDREKKLRFIDIDWSLPPRVVIGPENNLIISYHNYQETPDLELVLSQMKIRHSNARYYKLATYAHSTLDALKMIHFQRRHPNVIGICMGEKGVITRLLSPFTYAPLTHEDKTAPGQLLWSELETIYHYRSITPHTRLYGLIGYPVAQSIGHLYHNDQFRQKKIDAVYLKMPLLPHEVSAFFELIQDLPFYGFSVTAPLKLKMGSSSPVNTLYRVGSQWESCNTDGITVKEILGSIKNKKVVILGTGGAAQAIARALNCPTTLRRGEAIPSYDILINATSSPSPDFEDRFIPGSLVMDISIRTTPFLQRACNAGSTVMDGLPMYFAQAELQSVIWESVSLNEPYS